jgi:hypothetical protein
MTTQTMQQAAAHHFGIAWDELNRFEQAHWEAAWVAGRAGMIAENERLKAVNFDYQMGASAEADEADRLRGVMARMQAMLETAQSERDQLKAEVEVLRQAAGLAVLLPQLDEALEDLELYGRHADQGYRQLKDWYRKVKLACAAIDAAMGKEAGHE